MPHYGAVFAEARVVVDGNLISAAGVTAGLDAALVLVSLLRGDAAAQEIQLAIEYAPNPIFDSGTPETAPAQVLESFQNKYKPIGTAREKEAMRYAAGNPVKAAGGDAISLSDPGAEGPSARSA